MIAVVSISIVALLNYCFVLTVQNYICLMVSATNGYELFSIHHQKKNEMLLSKFSIAIRHIAQKH